jgi:IS605 OrfB family transposase
MTFKIQKTLIIPTQQDKRIEELYNVYSQAFRLAYVSYSYKQLRRIFPSYNSSIIANAFYYATKFRKMIIKTHNYPKKLNLSFFFRVNDYNINGNEIKIIYKPKNRLKVSIFPSENQIKLMSKARLKGGHLVRKDSRFEFHLTLEKDVNVYDWKEAKSFIGVDIGINCLAVCSAFDGKKFGNSLFFKGGEWKHLCDRKRKVTCSEEYKKLTRRQNEILHTVSKRIVEYAKQFSKPIIVLEKLGNFNNSNWNKRWNFLLSFWARRKLQKFIEYKAKWEGVPIAYVNPYKTSRICCYCDSEGKRDSINFYCLNCRRQLNADFNASVNLAKTAFQRATSSDREAFPEGFNAFGKGNTYMPISHLNPTKECQADENNDSNMEVELGLGIESEEKVGQTAL